MLIFVAMTNTIVFGYIDESGTPGVAVRNNDFLVISLVLFASADLRDKAIKMIDELAEKLKLPVGYEFHCSSNSTRPQTEFIKLLTKIKFEFITAAIRKNDFRKTASYARIVEFIVNKIEKRYSKIKIEMDVNKNLYSEFRKQIRGRKLNNVRICERNSRSSRLLQVADYVVNISAKKLKHGQKLHEKYRPILKKAIVFADIS